MESAMKQKPNCFDIAGVAWAVARELPSLCLDSMWSLWAAYYALKRAINDDRRRAFAG